MFAWHMWRMAESSQTDSRALLLPSLAVAGTVLSWAAAFPAIGYALRELEPLPLAAIRFALASVLAFAWLAWKRPKPMSAKDYAIVAVCGVLGIAAYNVFLNSGQTTVSAGAASFIVNTQPLFMAILAVLFLKEAFNRWSWAGTVVGLGGVAVIAAGQPGGMSFGTGSSLIIAAALCTSAYSVLQRQLFARSGPLEVTAYVLITGAIALLPWLAEGVAQLQAASTSTVATVVFLAVAPAAIGQTCWTVAIKSFGAARAGQFLYLIPPTALLLAWIGLDEIPGWATLAGGTLALAGVVVVNTWGRRQAPVPTLVATPEDVPAMVPPPRRGLS
jgi:drug/metabolite transporter (DMT)-like permease